MFYTAKELTLADKTIDDVIKAARIIYLTSDWYNGSLPGWQLEAGVHTVVNQLFGSHRANFTIQEINLITDSIPRALSRSLR